MGKQSLGLYNQNLGNVLLLVSPAQRSFIEQKARWEIDQNSNESLKCKDLVGQQLVYLPQSYSIRVPLAFSLS